jgi:uncharacterized protein
VADASRCHSTTAVAGDQHAPDRLRSAPIEGGSSQERSIGDPGFTSPHVAGQTLTDDAREVIAWLAAQTWCTGAVGMMGVSWGGFNALQVTSLKPPALRAIVTVGSSDDRYRDDVHYMGGTLLKAGIDWGSFLLRAVSHPPDPALVGDRWLPMWRQRLENVPLFLEGWMRHQPRDDYWRHGSVCEDYGAIQCPVFAVGGWTDGYTNTIPRLLERLQTPSKGLIGPWAHGYPHIARPGPQIGFLQQTLRWWDHGLKGEGNGVMDEPMLRAWISANVAPAADHVELPGKMGSAVSVRPMRSRTVSS